MTIRFNRQRALIHVLLYLVLLACLASCGPSESLEAVQLHADEVSAAIHLEPIDLAIPDASGPVLVEIRSPGANIESQLVLADGQVISRVHFEYQRSAPSFHYFDASDSTRGLQIRIIPHQTSAGAEVTARFFVPPESGRFADSLRAAWRDLASGQQRVDTLDEAVWSANLASMASAQTQLQDLGQDQISLWAAYMHAYMSYFPLYRYEEAASEAHALLDAVTALETRSGPDEDLKTIAVLAHQLAGQILLESKSGGRDDEGTPPLQAAREHFSTARDLAEESALPFEQTWAMNNLGIAWFYEDKLSSALESYALALEQAESSKDNYMTALIGTNLAVAKERSGNINEAVRMLEQIRQEATMQQSVLEREYMLGLLGNYYLKLYRFPAALAALNEAMYWSNQLESSENRGRNRVMLGRAYREMGQPEKALAFTRLAVSDLETVQDKRGLRQAHRLLADLHRLEGDFDAMEQARKREQELLETDLDHADWLVDSARDAMAQGKVPVAVTHFRDGAEAFAANGFNTSSGIARLQACAAEVPLHQSSECTIENLQTTYDGIYKLQASAPALRARTAWIGLLNAQGHYDLALQVAEDLVNEVQFYRQTLPGVLGAWYWDSRQEVFAEYLQLLLDAPNETQAGRPDVLLALDRLRNAHASDGALSDRTSLTASGVERSGQWDQHAPDGASLRALLARRDRAKTAEDRVAAQRLIDRELAMAGVVLDYGEAPDEAEFLRQLRRLPPDWSLLAYYLAGPNALAWVGESKGLQIIELGPSEPILQLIERVGMNIRIYNDPSTEADLASLGALLIGPLLEQLRSNLMVAGGGALGDLPLEALLIEGQPLLATHQVLHIQSVLAAEETAIRAVKPLVPQRLFLAGNPNTSDDAENALPGSRMELEALQAAFPTASASVYAQKDLTPDSFHSGSFLAADLVHLASHASIDRDYPELSRLTLSEAGDTDTAYLTPADIDGSKLAARLIVLSACETVGLNRFDFDNRLGFVSEMLRSDALVVASLWPVSDRATQALMSDFYSALATTGNVPLSLRTAKLKHRAALARNDLSWAAFQLFSR